MGTASPRDTSITNEFCLSPEATALPWLQHLDPGTDEANLVTSKCCSGKYEAKWAPSLALLVSRFGQHADLWGAQCDVAKRHRRGRRRLYKAAKRERTTFSPSFFLSNNPSKLSTMQLTSTILSFFAVAASAAPASGSGSACPASTRKFGIMALRSASPIHFAAVGASQNGISLNLPDNKLDAQCTDGKSRKDATFYIKDEVLYLYGKGDAVQKFRVDISGMGKTSLYTCLDGSAVTNESNTTRSRKRAIFYQPSASKREYQTTREGLGS